MTTPDQSSAKAILDGFLADYGLTGLGDWAWNKVLHGESADQIKLEMRDTDAYKQRFPAMEALAKQGYAMSESDYINQENAYKQVFHAYGLPAGFYDKPEDFAKFMTGNVSPSELNDRVKTYSAAVLGDTETLNQLRTLYDAYGHDGNPTGDLLAHYLDPNAAAPLLSEQLQAAQFASAAKTSGFGQLTAAQAEQFGARADTTQSQAQQGFGQLVHGRELFGALPGEQADQITQSEQLGAAFGGDAMAQEKINRRAQTRVAAGAGGGGFSSTQRGAVGLASSEI